MGADGYVMYKLDKARWVAAHQLVAEAFLGPPPFDGAQVAHANGSRLMSHYANLRWATALENQRDRIAHGTAPAGARNGRAKITEDDVRYIRRRYREIKLEGGSVSELDEKFKLSRSQVILIAMKKAWSHVMDQ